MPNLACSVASADLTLLKRLLTHVPSGTRSSLARGLMQDRYANETRALAHFFIEAIHAWQNRQYDVHRNGEAALLDRLGRFDLRVVFDVGANIGEWALSAVRSFPKAVIHAFEIAPTTAEKLVRRTDQLGARVRINRFGLGSHAGDVSIYGSEENNTATSMLRPAIDASIAERNIKQVFETTALVNTGDEYLRKTGTQHIDFLKIDVEGAEMEVLRGFRRAFEQDAVDLVQFEYGRINLATRVFLQDFHHFFTDRGFKVGKIFPEGVAFKTYEIEDEDFIGPNYLACRKERTDIIDELCCPPLRPASGIYNRNGSLHP